jgi:hypothetical protein
MSVTKYDLRDFTIFAVEKLDNGGANSLVELAREWEAKRSGSQVTLDVQIDATTAKWLAEYFPDIHDDERLQRALARRGGVTTAEMLSNAAAAAKDAGQG